MQFRAFEPGIEVQGAVLQWMVAGFKFMPATGLTFLAKFGLTSKGADGKPTLDLAAWYSHDGWLRCFEALQRDVGENSIFEIGKKVGSSAVYPVPVSDIHSGVKLLDPGYHFYHRKQGWQMFDPATGQMLEGIGHYGYESAGEKRIVSVCNNPYPCVFDHGLLTGVAQRFEPRARVEHDAAAPCRAKGGESCRLVVSW